MSSATAAKSANTTNGTSSTKMSEPEKAPKPQSSKPRPGRPWWRPIVDGIDRNITPPANSLVRTNVFADTVATITRLEVRLRRRVERQSSWLLHQYNLPTAGDMRKVRAQLASIEARLRDMSERLEDQQYENRRAERRARTAKPAVPQSGNGPR
jgi:hypothetical protein